MGRTVAIVDFAHSGTTMLAGVCEILGVPMVGDYYKPMKWEDREVVGALKHEPAFAALVARRNAQYDVWGFKYPGAWKFMHLLRRYLRDPIYLAIFKDPIAVTRRRFHTVTGSKIADTLVQMKAAIDGMKATGEDFYILSYHQATVVPLEFVTQVAALIGAEPTNGQIDCAVGFIQPHWGDPRRRYPSVEQWT